jgi:hypothetical protein
MSVVWETSPAAFAVLTLVFGGAGAWMTGRALARGWRPLWPVVIYAALLGLVVRFLHYALAHGSLLSLQYYFIDTVLLVLSGIVAWRTTRARQMVTQYPWLYRRTSPFTWAERTPVAQRE